MAGSDPQPLALWCKQSLLSLLHCSFGKADRKNASTRFQLTIRDCSGSAIYCRVVFLCPCFGSLLRGIHFYVFCAMLTSCHHHVPSPSLWLSWLPWLYYVLSIFKISFSHFLDLFLVPVSFISLVNFIDFSFDRFFLSFTFCPFISWAIFLLIFHLIDIFRFYIFLLYPNFQCLFLLYI